VVPIRVLIVDDHRVFGDALATRLDAEPDLTVVGVSTSVAQGEAAIEALSVDVAIVDVDLGEDDGIVLLRRLRQSRPETKVVIVSCHDDPQTVCEGVLAGALSFIPKDAPMEQLCAAVRGAVHEESVIPPHLLGRLLRELEGAQVQRNEHQRRVGRLTPRELAVLECLVAGLDRESVAKQLRLTLNTVRTHVQNCYAKLGVHSSLEAVNVALLAGVAPRTRPEGTTGPSPGGGGHRGRRP
jgi:DNA-binding NarL/FixJ family response regulator